MAISAFDEITAKKPYKALLEPLKRTGGRNNTGKMTVRNRGGGHKRMYRIIDFLRDKDNMKATVKTIEYDPNRSARIALVEYEDGEKRYIIAPAGIKVGQIIESGSGVAPDLGNCLPLAEMPVGTLVHNIELRPGQGAAMARSAGTFAQLAAREGNHAIIRLPSGETRMVLVNCRATVGTVSNSDHNLESSGRPGAAVGWAVGHVLAVSMNLSITRWVVVKDARPEVTLARARVFLQRVTGLVTPKLRPTGSSSREERKSS